MVAVKDIGVSLPSVCFVPIIHAVRFKVKIRLPILYCEIAGTNFFY